MLNDKFTQSYGECKAMSTKITYSLYGENTHEAMKKIEEEITQLENQLSRFVPNSVICNINNNAGVCAIKVNNDIFKLILSTKEFSLFSKGLFDITISPLIDLWNYKEAKECPNNSQIKKIKSFVNYKDIILDDKNKTIYLKKKHQSIDLGGIGKGYIGDEVLNKVSEMGISSAFINIGGNVSTIGKKPDGTSWSIGIQHPRDLKKIIGALQTNDKSVVTSGDYQRFFIDENGARYHHILNPKTGYPSNSGIISATVIAKNGMTADALSTICFLFGIKRSLKIIKKFNVDVIFIDENLDVFITKNLKNNFITNKDVKIKVLN